MNGIDHLQDLRSATGVKAIVLVAVVGVFVVYLKALCMFVVPVTCVNGD